MTSTTAYVVPCFNEAARLDAAAWIDLAARGVTLLFVDDGSTDQTLNVLEGMCAASPGMRILRQPRNRGKAEAVRCGLLELLRADTTTYVGYADADLATPPSELVRLPAYLDAEPRVDLVMGSRIAFLGATIDRSAWRHYLGRVFATGASLTLGLPVYDTQCGAKVFRADARLADACRVPFGTGWAFDVELLARLLGSDSPYVVHELPLREWQDVGQSKVTARGVAHAALGLATLALRTRLFAAHRPRRNRTAGS